MIKFTFPAIFFSLCISKILAEDCFQSIIELNLAQVVDLQSGNTDEVKEYQLCSGTYTIGEPDLSFNFPEGGYPFFLGRPNAILSCEGNCIIDAKAFHLVSAPIVPYGGTYITGITTDNVTVKGFTFTGGTTLDPSYVSVALAAPGKNIVFEDCAWKDIVFPNIIYAGPGEAAPVIDNKSVEVTFRNSTFDDISYQYTVFNTYAQSLSVESCTFNNIEFSRVKPYGFFFRCRASTCKFTKNCVNNATYLTSFLFRQDESGVPTTNQVRNLLETTLTFSNNYGNNVEIVPNGTEKPVCDQGYGANTILKNNAYEECSDPFESTVCPLLTTMSTSGENTTTSTSGENTTTSTSGGDTTTSTSGDDTTTSISGGFAIGHPAHAVIGVFLLIVLM
jgi:hypothetical protein